MRQAALAAETSLFELIHVIGPLVVAALTRARHGYGPALLVAAAVTLLGGLAVARVPVLRIPRRTTRRPMRRVPGFGALLLCAGLLGTGFGAITIGVPAFAAELRRAERKLPMALLVLWTVWGAVSAVNLMVWFLVVVTVAGDVYPWPVWLLVPGAALAASTVGVQAIRRQRRRR